MLKPCKGKLSRTVLRGNEAVRLLPYPVTKREIMMSELIISNPKIMMGKPVIKGTRITVELILEKLSYGESVDQILNEHPRLTQEAIQASCAFAAEALKADVIYPVEEAAA